MCSEVALTRPINLVFGLDWPACFLTSAHPSCTYHYRPSTLSPPAHYYPTPFSHRMIQRVPDQEDRTDKPAHPSGSADIMSDHESDSEPNERTTMQQEKALAAKKQAKREAGLQSARSRSSSRRARRQRIQKGMQDGKYMKTTSLEALEEADANGELNSMQAFERIGPDSTSMDGPVTKARAMRGEIPMRGTDPNQPYRMPQEAEKKGGLDEQDGLKLKLEANLEIEIELKASIRGDLTLSLL